MFTIKNILLMIDDLLVDITNIHKYMNAEFDEFVKEIYKGKKCPDLGRWKAFMGATPLKSGIPRYEFFKENAIGFPEYEKTVNEIKRFIEDIADYIEKINILEKAKELEVEKISLNIKDETKEMLKHTENIISNYSEYEILMSESDKKYFEDIHYLDNENENLSNYLNELEMCNANIEIIIVNLLKVLLEECNYYIDSIENPGISIEDIIPVELDKINVLLKKYDEIKKEEILLNEEDEAFINVEPIIFLSGGSHLKQDVKALPYDQSSSQMLDYKNMLYELKYGIKYTNRNYEYKFLNKLKTLRDERVQEIKGYQSRIVYTNYKNHKIILYLLSKKEDNLSNKIEEKVRNRVSYLNEVKKIIDNKDIDELKYNYLVEESEEIYNEYFSHFGSNKKSL